MPYLIEPEAGEGPPPGYHVESRRQIGLLKAGITTLGTSLIVYVPTAVFVHSIPTSCSDDLPERCKSGSAAVFVPFVGPFIAMGQHKYDPWFVVGLGALGVAQVTGLVLTLAGLSSRTVFVRDGAAARWRVTPFGGRGALGIGVEGRM